MASLLSLDDVALTVILRKLPPLELLYCASTCRKLRELAFEGGHAKPMWERHCVEEFGVSQSAMHANFMFFIPDNPHQDPTNDQLAAVTRKLYNRLAIMGDICWREECSRVLPARAKTAGMSLSRYGHAAASLVDFFDVLISGGVKGGRIGRQLDVFLVRAIKRAAGAFLEIHKVQLQGPELRDRFWHTMTLVNPPPGSKIWKAVEALLSDPKAVSEGHFLVPLGGCRSVQPNENAFISTDVVEVIWLDKRNLAAGASVRVQTTGQFLGNICQHTADACADGTKIVVAGGHLFGRVPDWARGLKKRPVIFELDLATMAWTWHPTDKHRSVWQCPASGTEFLVVAGGCRGTKMPDTLPERLNLSTWMWTPVLHPLPRILPRCQQYIPPRHSAACFRVSRSWLLIHGGWPAASMRPPPGALVACSDLWALHLPSLHYRRVREWTPASFHPHRAMHTMAGGLACGGGSHTDDNPPGLRAVQHLGMLLLGKAADFPYITRAAEIRGTQIPPPRPPLTDDEAP